MSVAEYLRGRETQPNATVNDSSTSSEVPTRHIELIDITEKSRGYGDQPMLILTSSYLQAKDNLGKYDEYALILRRKVDKEGDETSTTLEVRSKVIRDALKSLLSSYGYLNLEACPIEIKKPYDALFHYRHEIREYAKAPERNTDDKRHLQILTKFMDTNLLATERLYTQMVPKGMIDFDHLWTLFRAEDIVVMQTDDFRQCYGVISCSKITIDGDVFFELHVWYWGYNGYKFGPVEEKLRILEFTIPRRITQLPFYPLALLGLQELSNHQKDFVRRGKLWKTMVDVGHMQYHGEYEPCPSEDPSLFLRAHMDRSTFRTCREHVKADQKPYHRSHERENFRLATSLHGSGGSFQSPDAMDERRRQMRWLTYFPNDGSVPRPDASSPSHGSLNDMKCHNNDADYEITDEQALLTPARVRGFSLENKKWAFFLIEGLTEVKWNSDAFTKLEIDQTMKTYVKSLVMSHSSKDSGFDDLITNKGKGLIMLLHGPPGTGKTLTAESIADFTRKPLYHIGTGELGTHVSFTEPVLTKIFNYAKEWGAILLLDEADCFLSKRTKDDMERNAFVTIFLCLLEYYQGILFLTTNRIEEFDSAFQSRIHLVIEYRELDATRRACVWRNLLSGLPYCADWGDEVFERLGREIVVNGREIKNLIRTSLAITYNTGGLTEEALMIVYRLNLKRPMRAAGN